MGYAQATLIELTLLVSEKKLNLLKYSEMERVQLFQDLDFQKNCMHFHFLNWKFLLKNSFYPRELIINL
ncbi:hypothetical protein HA45_23895 [Pantoea rodasii]|nr:hypothetical protein HA45_23895 [Pantoea rodasii]